MSAPPYEAVPQNAYSAAPPVYAQPPVQVYQQTSYQQAPTTPLIVTSQPHHWGEMYVEFVKIVLEIPSFLCSAVSRRHYKETMESPIQSVKYIVATADFLWIYFIRLQW